MQNQRTKSNWMFWLLPEWYYCHNCGKMPPNNKPTNYCPNCGAEMLKKKERGHWILQEPKGVWTHNYQCSKCGGMVLSCEVDLPKYCGHCGMEMET